MSDLLHTLFYWNYNGRYILSKTKLISLFFFIVCFVSLIPTTYIAANLLGSLVLAGILFLIGFALHMILADPSQAKLENSDNGFISDIINLLFFWQDKSTGEYTLSKTKLISAAIALISGFFALINGAPTLLAYVMIAMIFSLPAFVIGSVIHRLAPPKQIESKPQRQVSQKPEVSELKAPDVTEEVRFKDYKVRIDDLKSVYEKKERNLRGLIEKKFEPPQMSYDKFIAVVDSSTKLFNHQYDSAMSIIELAAEESPKIEAEIRSKIEVMESIIDKVDSLTNELVINMSKSKNDDNELRELAGEMEKLIDSVKDYE